MPPNMIWLARVAAVAIVPVFLGAVQLLAAPDRSGTDLAIAIGLLLLCAAHLFYWLRPWPTRQRRAVVAAAVMVLTNLVLFNLLGVSQPLLWLYPALIAGAGLPPAFAAVGVALTALAASAP